MSAPAQGPEPRADPELHPQLARIVQEALPQGSRVLDWGAGEGALAQRLLDAGYAVEAVDKDASGYRAEAPFEAVDFDDRASVEDFLARRRGRYDLVLVVEVIEHVENPWQLMRDARALARPGGLVLVSTPNITHPFSRAWFAARGRHAQFDENDLAYGHIHPLTDLELRAICKGVGLEVLRIDPAGRQGLLLPGLPPKMLLLNLLAALASPLMRGPKRGYCLAALLRRPADGQQQG